MQNDFIPQIEPTPIITKTRCKIVSFMLRIFLQLGSYLIGLLTWYKYDYFIAIAIFLLSFVVIGIIRSKLRNSVIPKTQQEYNYNDKGIADWYTSRELCF